MTSTPPPQATRSRPPSLILFSLGAKPAPLPAMQMIQGFHWYEYPLSWFYYLICSTVDHALVFALGCFALIFVSFLARPSYRRLFSRWAIFNVILFVIGAIISGFWDCLVYGHLYVTADYVSDFSPFIPVTQGVIDAHFDAYSGHLIGVTLRQLQFVWLLFAFVTWALASVIYLRRDRIWWYATHLTKRMERTVDRRALTLR